jgi:hypothetical protein
MRDYEFLSLPLSTSRAKDEPIVVRFYLSSRCDGFQLDVDPVYGVKFPSRFAQNRLKR